MAAQAKALRGTLRENHKLARYTTWRVGGPAALFYAPADADDLAAFLAQLPAAMPVYWLGLGSNLLVRDGGVPGAVIATATLVAMTQLDDTTVRVEAGTPCAKVARFCTQQGLLGAEFLAGIPGTMGGALAMNAGAFGGETWSLVVAVETVDRCGRRHQRAPAEYEIGYRHVRGPVDQGFIAAHLRLVPGDAAAGMERVRALLEQRNQGQPMGQRSCGSVFRNPAGDHAARLIEASGLKGRCRGQACVSDKHANFIINHGGATATDIEGLIQVVAMEVEARTGVVLTPEVQIVGEPEER